SDYRLIQPSNVEQASLEIHLTCGTMRLPQIALRLTFPSQNSSGPRRPNCRFRAGQGVVFAAEMRAFSVGQGGGAVVDGERFDFWTRSLNARRPRRWLLRGFVGGVVLAALGRERHTGAAQA